MQQAMHVGRLPIGSPATFKLLPSNFLTENEMVLLFSRGPEHSRRRSGKQGKCNHVIRSQVERGKAARKSIVKSCAVDTVKLSDIGRLLNDCVSLSNEARVYTRLRASIVVCKKNVFDLPDGEVHVHDDADERLGQKISLQLVSLDVDKSLAGTGMGKRSQEVTIENWIDTPVLLGSTMCRFDLNFLVERNFGVPGAFIIRNRHRDEFFLQTFNIEMPDNTVIHFLCYSRVYNTKAYKTDRIFFSNKVYLPKQTPAGLVQLRESELQNLRGDGSGKREISDRIYDYATYNDLGDADSHSSLKRPVLGGSAEFPYPRRMRTGRPSAMSDPGSESRGEVFANFYIPCDEKFIPMKDTDPLADAIKGAAHKMLPALQDLYSEHSEFKSLHHIKDLYEQATDSKGLTDLHRESYIQTSPLDLNTQELAEDRGVVYPLPRVIAVDEQASVLDEEFAREMLAGLNPMVIECLTEFPLISKLDAATYGDPISGITAEHIELQLEGLDVQEAVAEKKLFVLDYHDTYLPYINKINEQKTSQAYATRTVLFLTTEGTLKPVAIELSLPPQDPGGESVKRVVTPPVSGTKDWVWQLAKAHVLANDSGYHQLINHWLRTHATLEPIAIATNRQLSALHPVNQVLLPHFKNTLDINAAARKALINAGGIIEKTFTPQQYSMEMSSVVYKLKWRFDEQALPADLIKRGMAVVDPTAEHGLKLVIEDYPFAADGLELWGAIRTWLNEYITLFYCDDGSVQEDEELQSWWTEIRSVGHGDKKDEEGWPMLNSTESLVETLTILVWLASCHHAAVNFGQYDYAGYMPNHPTTTRRLIPDAGTPEFTELQSDPEAFYLSTVSNETQAKAIMSTVEVLSTHSSNEEYLGQRSVSNWTDDERVLAAFGKFAQSINEIEELIRKRNMDKQLKNRYGSVELPYELLYRSSDTGVTGKGVPNSTSI